MRERDEADLRMPRWVVVWLVISACIQTYDALYELLGPLSHAGGRLAGLWPGHVFYSRFDHRYAGFDAFGSAQSWANLLEVVVIVWALVLRRRFSGLVLALVVSTATFWKTVLYFLVEITSGLAMTRQSLEQGDLVGFLSVAVLPNLVWIVVPLSVVVALGRQAVRVGRRAAVRAAQDDLVSQDA
jgi:uroporphyrin-III C-methyltransferase